MTSKPIDLLRRELHAFCELAIRRGWRIQPDGYGDEKTRTLCPLGAVNIIVKGVVVADSDEALIGNIDEVVAFGYGFDGSPRHTGPCADLGREFRAFYCPEES
jgi:hypothetical protein